MKFIPAAQAQQFKNSEACIVNEYSFGNPALDIALIKINGRYPEKGRVFNERSLESVFVIEGNGRVVVEGKEVVLQKGDAVLIEPNERFHWEGAFTMVVPCAPAWSPEQYKECE